ncbi:MAG: hypothetical protein ACRC0V_11730 [Fusobacteriaceae bacterium]
MNKVIVGIFIIFKLCSANDFGRHDCISQDENDFNLILYKIAITKNNTLKLEYLREAYSITNHMLSRHTEEEEIADDYFNIQKVLGKVYLDILTNPDDSLERILLELEKAKM